MFTTVPMAGAAWGAADGESTSLHTVENLRRDPLDAIARHMPVARATYARSVTYTVTDRPDPDSHPADLAAYRRQSGWPRTTSRPRRAARPGQAKDRSSQADIQAVDCARCDVEMQVAESATRGLHYLVCPGCNARFASSYEEVLTARAGVKPRTEPRPSPEATDRWRTLRDRAEAFQRRIEDNDPYRCLGLSPGTPFAEVRARYRALAARHHPDLGGDAERMRRIIEAYETIRAALARSAVAASGPAEASEPVSSAAAARRPHRTR
jgi:hypothetical protein